jgi:hypothetical protein
MSTYPLVPEIVFVETKKINNYKYLLSELKPHISVRYDIYCYDGDAFVKNITGLLEGQDYLDWTNDDFLDAFIKAKVIASQ